MEMKYQSDADKLIIEVALDCKLDQIFVKVSDS